ncbi:MAG: hypothetical protein WC897_00590 [Candidatus Gracilibacteria bacterium]
MSKVDLSGSDHDEVELRVQRILDAIMGDASSVELDDLERTRESVRALITNPIEAICRMYGYKPFPPTTQRIDLGKVTIGSLVASLKDDHFAEFDSLVHLDSLASSQLNTSSGHTLNLVARKLVKANEAGTQSESMHVELINPEKDRQDANHCVCNFWIKKVDRESCDEWDLRDRVTAEAYQGQGVASEMLRFVESQLAKMAEETDRSQVMTVELAQVDVLFWLLKEGFVPATHEDEERIGRLLKGDDSLTIVSAPGEQDHSQKRQWYIFEKKEYFGIDGSPKPGIWDKAYFPKESFRIHLKKEIR